MGKETIMPVTDLSSWLEEQAEENCVWLVKRLSANDTGLTGSHQGGPYLPKRHILKIIPAINEKEIENPEFLFHAQIASHSYAHKIRAIWYNNKTRNETRLTQWGGKKSALLDTENTGALVVFAFRLSADGNPSSLEVWVCDQQLEEDLVEEHIGPIEPGYCREVRFGKHGENSLFSMQERSGFSCALSPEEIPVEWKNSFPSPADLIDLSIKKKTLEATTVDERLMKRRKCEFEIFQSIEEHFLLPQIKNGFDEVEPFLSLANSTLQRRKARSGRSLELQLQRLFEEESFKEGNTFDAQKVTEARSKPDFIFPSQSAYQDSSFPADNLRILAVKTTAKDRWRQILTEATRVKTKHLLTLQEGISDQQYAEMKNANVKLVVPTSVQSSYPQSYRHELISLEDFMGELRVLPSS
jgi:hypothetical protein